MKSNFFTLDRLVYLVLSVAVFTILILRAILVPFSHDEVATFFNYVQQFDPWPFFSIPDANNHILNTYITFLFYKLFGSGILALRLSNLVFVPFYLYFTYKLSQEVKNSVLRWIFILAMVGTFHYMEFFALTRGYGISLTFLLAAIWLVLKAMKTGRSKYFHIANLMMFLSSLSILIELYNFTLLLGWSALYILYHSKGRRVKELLFLFLSGGIPLILILSYTLFLQKHGAYIERGPTGLWEASLATLMSFITGFTGVQLQKFMLLLSAMVLLPLLAVGIFSVIRKKWLPHPHLLFPYLFFGNLAIIVIVVKFFFSDYPESRLVLFLFPILAGSIIFTLDLLISQSKVKALIILALPLLIFPLLTIRVFNFDYTTWYKYCHIPQRYYQTIMKGHKAGDNPPLVSGYGTQAWAWQFLVRNNGGIANELCVANFPEQLSDYKIINLMYFPGWHKNFDTLDFDPVSKLRLLKRRKSFKEESDTTIQLKPATPELENKSMILLEQPLKQWAGMHLKIDFDLSIETAGSLFYGSVVMAAYDTTGKNYLFDEIHLNWLRDQWDGQPHNFIKSWLMPELPGNVDYLKIFVWNKNEGFIRVKEGAIHIQQLSFPDNVY